jgi:hypothetical protein
MTKRIFTIACALLLLFAGSMQAQSDFNPELPPDPETPKPPVVKYELTAVCNPTAAGSASGKGSYVAGTTVKVSTSANAEYTFSHWELNGERYEAATGTSFNYVTVAGPMNFVAVYKYTPTPFNPSNPSEPYATVKSRLYLVSKPAGVCTFNRTNGASWTVDSYVQVSITYVDQQYAFDGWYLGETLLTTERSFNHQIPYHDATLEARFTRLPDPEPEPEIPFDPENPNDPNMSDKQEEEVETHAKEDVNKDGEINVIDATAVIMAYLNGDSSNKRADVNRDGEINVMDATAVIMKLLESSQK